MVTRRRITWQRRIADVQLGRTTRPARQQQRQRNQQGANRQHIKDLAEINALGVEVQEPEHPDDGTKSEADTNSEYDDVTPAAMFSFHQLAAKSDSTEMSLMPRILAFRVCRYWSITPAKKRSSLERHVPNMLVARLPHVRRDSQSVHG